MATLFELVNEYNELYNLATEDGDPVALADTLEAWMPVIEQKAQGYINVIQTLEMEAKRAKEIAAEFTAKQKARENSVKSMKQMLLMALDGMGKKELPAGDFTIKVQANGGKKPLIIDQEDAIPDSMLKVIYEADKERIREYLESGNECEWAHLEERGRHIAIK